MNVEKYTFTSAVDGVKGDYYLRNAGVDTACLVWLHGYGSMGDQCLKGKDAAAYLTPMVEMYDLSLFSPDLRGNAWMSAAAVEDLRDMLTELREKYRFSRFLFLGGSMGGSGALIFASLYPELVDGLGILGGATDLFRFREYALKQKKAFVQGIARAITENYSPEDFEKHNVCKHFRNLTMPLCFYHGESDLIIPVSEMTALKECMSEMPNAEFKAVRGTHGAPLAFMQEVFEKISGLRDFRKVNAREHEVPRSPYNLFTCLQGEYFLSRRDENDPVCLRHARSIGYALERLPLSFAPDQMFFGGVEQYAFSEFSEGSAEEVYQEKAKVSKEMCQRTFATGWDHTAPDYRRLMTEGLGGFIRRAREAFEKYGTPESQAMLISLQALSAFFVRAADFWQEKRPAEAAVLRKNALLPPGSFAEALQLIWGVFVVLEAQGRGHNALARLDQYLWDVYEKDTIDATAALNMLCHIFCKIEGFHQVTNICIGGVKSDGSDAVNPVSYLILKAVERVRSASTNLSARVHRDSPDGFLKACIRLIATGIGFPAIMNDDVYISSLQKCGIVLEDARDYALFGCVEGNIPGRAPAWSDSRFTLPEHFVGVIERLEEFEDYDELFKAFADSVKAGLQKHLAEYNEKLRAFPPEKFPDPLLSALTRSCIERGRDINDGGADFPRQHGVGMVGPATVADSLAAIKKLVFEEKRISKKELLTALHNNFENAEILRQTLINCAPKFGNDDPYVDSIFAEIVKLCGETAAAMRTCDGGYLKSCMASNVSNIPCGRTIPATPDGRLAWSALSDAASPDGGLDKNGPTAFMNSITLPDYSAQNCTVVNMRFLPEMFADEAGFERMLVLLKKFITGGGHEIQFNVTDNKTLFDAIENPEKYGDLIVRVSGFSALFTRLDPQVQQDIIRRNAHGK